MIIGSETQEEVHAAFLARFNAGPADQGYLIGLSSVLHAITDLLVADVLPKFAGRGTSSDSIPMEYVAQLLIESISMGQNLKEQHEEGYDQSVRMALHNLLVMMGEQPDEDESE